MIGEIVLVREAGVDRDALRGLHDDGIVAAMSELKATGTARVATAAAITNALFDVIADADGPHRGLLVAARRAVHNGRASASLLSIARASLSVETRALLAEWETLGERVTAQRVALEERLEQGESAEHEHLRNWVADPLFARGLAATSEELAGRTARWSFDPRTTLGRKSSVVLARMLARAAAKTSPFSAWMTTAPARWGQRPDGRTENGRLVAELDGVLAEQFTRRLREEWDRGTDVLLQLNPSIVALKSGWLFIRTQPREQLVRVAEHSAVFAILALMERPRTATQLREHLPSEAVEWIARCRSAGLLEPVWPVADLEPRPWAAWAEAFSLSSATALGVPLRALDDALARADRPDVVQAAQALAARLELTPTTITVHEVRIADSPRSEVPDHIDDNTAAELDQIRRLLALFDPKMPMKIAASELLRSEFGNEDVPLVCVFETLQRSLSDPRTDLGRLMGPSAPPWGPDLRACTSADLRSLGDKLHALSCAVLEAAASGALTVAEVRELIDRSGIEHPNRSATLYMQIVHGEDVDRVITVAHGGHGRGKGRFAAQYGAHLSDLTIRPNEEVVELCGTLGSTLNVRRTSTSRELQYPGAVSGRPAGEQIAMSEILVRAGVIPVLHDRDGHRVRPVHLGMAADLALPPFARMIEQIFGSAFLMHPSAPPFAAGPPQAFHANEMASPRVVVGRTVVQRARWFLQAEAFPARTGNTLQRLESWFSWVEQRSLKPRFFLRAWDPSESMKQSKARKPLFIDLCSRLLFADAEKLLQSARFAIIEECLPDPLVGEGHIAEYVVQVGEE